MSYKLLLQSRAAECGLVCAAMILRRLAVDVDLNQLRELYPVGRDGMSTAHIRHLVLDYGVPSKEGTGGLDEIAAELSDGSQVMVNLDFSHFCLVESVDNRWVKIVDPSRGRVKLTRFEAEQKISRQWWIFPDRGVESALKRIQLNLRDMYRSPALGIVLRSLKANPALLVATVVVGLLMLVGSGAAPIAISAVVDAVTSGEALSTTVLAVGLVAAVGLFMAVSLARTALEAFLLKVAARDLGTAGVKRKLDSRLDVFSTYAPGDIVYSLAAVNFVSTTIFINGSSVVFSALTVLTLLGVVFYLWPLMALILVGLLAVLCLVFFVAAERINQYASEEAAAGGALSSQQLETIITMAAIKMTNTKDHFFDRWAETNERHLHSTTLKTVWTGVITAVTTALTVFGPLIPIIISLLFPNSVSGLGAVVASSGLFSVFISSTSQLLNGVTSLTEARGLMAKVDDLLQIPQEYEGSQRVDSIEQITAENVSYRYLGSSVQSLDQVNLRIDRYSHNTFVGSSGSGKSTFARLLTGLHRPSCGRVHINGIDIAEISPESRAQLFGFVPQENYLISGSIRDNIAFGRDVTDQEIWEALRVAQLEEVVNELPLGLDTPVGEMGNSFSGGQRQRFALSRAIVTRPSLLILDEATSAIDVPTERAITQALRELDMTLVSIAHRPTAVGDEDKILHFLDSGRVEVEEPDYLDQLMRKGIA